MARQTPSIYVIGTAPRSSKSILSLGLMEILAAQGRAIGFFRPVVNDRHDAILQLIHNRYKLNLPAEQLFGCRVEEARQLANDGDTQALFKRIIDRFKQAECHFELMVLEGIDSSVSIPGLEFDFNVRLANTLGALLVPVLNAHNQSIENIATATSLVQRTLNERDGEVLALVINRVAAHDRDLLQQALQRQQREDDAPIYLLNEHPVLAMPTVGEIAESLGAELIAGSPAALTREVADYKVAAMALPHFLDHLNCGSLVITPGDRADIIAGTLLAHAAQQYPTVAGLLLTGGLTPDPQILRVIDNLNEIPIPLLSTPADTFATAMAVNEVEPSLGYTNPRKIAAALALIEQGVDADTVRCRITLPRENRMTRLMFEYELVQRAKRQRRHIVLPEAEDDRILHAAEILQLREVVDITLLGDPLKIRQRIQELDLRLTEIRIVDPVHSPLRNDYAEALYQARRHKGVTRQMAWDMVEDISYFGTLMVHCGDADGMVSGAMHTTQHTIRPAFQVIRTKPGYRLISSVFLMSMTDNVLVYGDCAVNPNPSASDLADIAIASARTAQQFSIEPRIAMLSYSTGDSGRGEAVEKVRESVQIARSRAPDLAIEGPIQYDAAIDSSVARTKLPDSGVAGRATVFIFPDLNTGNNTYKAVQRSSGAVAIGPILQGLNKPVNDLSRGCTVTDIVNTVAITAIQAQSS